MQAIKILFFTLALMFTHALLDAQDLPPEVRADIERKRTENDIRGAVSAFEAGNFKQALTFIDKLKRAGISLPLSADYVEAKSAAAL